MLDANEFDDLRLKAALLMTLLTHAAGGRIEVTDEMVREVERMELVTYRDDSRHAQVICVVTDWVGE